MNKLKFIITGFLSLFLSYSSLSQLKIDNFYTDKTDYLICSHVEEFDTLSAEKISTLVKNWGGTNFTNMKEVLVSETEDQLVFNYVTTTFYTKVLGISKTYSWYIRLVIQIKDNKVRFLFYDDGNCFWPGSYVNGVNYPSTPARKFKFSEYFNDGICRKVYNGGLVNTKNNCENTLKNLTDYVKSSKSTSTSDGW